MTIETLPFEHRPRNSIANNLDKINELVDWTNLDTHLYASASGERVTVDDASSVKGLTVNGRSVKNGTPTPDSPVPVEVVSAKNLLPLDAQTVTNRGVTATVDATGTVTITGTATGGNAALTIPVASDVPLANIVDYTAQRVTVSGSFDGTFYVLGIDDANQTMHHLFNLASVTERTARFTSNAIMQAIYIVISENTTIDCVLHVQVEQGSTATDYIPHGNIALVIDGTQTTINLQGNKLASLPDDTRDELHVDSAGHCVLTKRVQRLYFDGSSSSGWSVGGNYASTGGGYWLYANSQGAVGTLLNTSYCDKLTYHNTSASSDLSGLTVYGNQAVVIRVHPFTPSGQMTVEQLMTWLQSNPLTFYVKHATPHTIDLGYIDPPAIPSGSVVTISASLTPTLHLEWWMDDGITTLVNDLIAYVDYKTEG